MKTLSSFTTLAYKSVFPALFIGLIFLGVYSRLDSGATAQISFGDLAALFVPVVIVTALFVPFALRLKEVALDGDQLRIVNYFKQCVVPLASVEKVAEVRFFRPSTVTLHLNIDTPFGRKIVFIPGSAGTWRHPQRVGDYIRERLAQLPPGGQASPHP